MAGARRIPVDMVEDCNGSLMSYVTKAKALPITQADISSITYTITDTSTGTAVSGHDNASLTVSDVVFDTLQTPTLDASWEIDSTGYNFRHDIAGTGWPSASPGLVYNYDCFIVTTAGAKIPVLFAISVIPVSRS
jgi:hypothetical protein